MAAQQFCEEIRMKNVRVVLVVAALLCIVLPSFALNVFMAFDVVNQKMSVVIRSTERDDQLWPNVTFAQEDTGGYICNVCEIYYPIPGSYSECVVDVMLSPNDAGRTVYVAPGDTNVIWAHIELFTDPERSERAETISLTDTLESRINPLTGLTEYAYPAGTECQPVMPDTIRINSAFCAWVCHGTYRIPIYCEAPDYNLELLNVNVADGCDPAAGYQPHCNDPVCPRNLDWDLFTWYNRIFPGCRLYLVMTNCGYEPGCVCIWRSDFYLPVEMLGFSGIAGDGKVRLDWSTASETGYNTFIITRSEDRTGLFRTVWAQEGTVGASRHDYSWTDNNVQNGRTYYYKLNIQDDNGQHVYNIDGQSVIVEATPMTGAEMPSEYGMAQNYPNPFNSETRFSFSLANDGLTTLKVFDVLGREVAAIVNDNLKAGTHTYNWSAEGLPTGVYMYTLTSGEFTVTKKMLFLK
ncbi:T9SS C-terminal target domain-containing protein [candidate division KSB1 bacterium]|nr:MAG: T9SS C-terminal target domain-containing protein [candidate division KSB1 bacterium]